MKLMVVGRCEGGRSGRGRGGGVGGVKTSGGFADLGSKGGLNLVGELGERRRPERGGFLKTWSEKDEEGREKVSEEKSTRRREKCDDERE